MLDSYLTYLNEQDIKNIKNQKLAKHYDAMAKIDRIINEAREEYHVALSGADRSCRGLEDKEKNTCMARYKQRALRNLRFNISKALMYCRDTKDQKKCQDKIYNKLDKIDAKLG